VQRALAVCVLQRLGRLYADACDVLEVQAGLLRRGVAHPRDDPVQSLALDVLHDVVVEAVALADAVDLDDVGVVQPACQPGLALEACQVPPLQQGLRRQDLQRHAPPEGLLLGLEDHAHAAAPDLADDLEVAQAFEPHRSQRGRAAGRPLRAGLEPLHRRHRREQIADFLGQVGMVGGVPLDRRRLPPPLPGQKILGQLVQLVGVVGMVGMVTHLRCSCLTRIG